MVVDQVNLDAIMITTGVSSGNTRAFFTPICCLKSAQITSEQNTATITQQHSSSKSISKQNFEYINAPQS